MFSKSAVLSLLVCVALAPIGAAWGQDSASVLDQAFYAIADYDGEPDSPSVRVIRNEVTAAQTSITKRIGVEVRLFEVLESSLSTDAARAFVAAQLARICKEDSVLTIDRLLTREDLTPLLIGIIKEIPGYSGTRALVRAVGATEGETQLTLIHALGERGDPSAIRTLRKYSGNGEPVVMGAAIEAIGAIGGRDAADAVFWCSQNVRSDLRPVAIAAYFKCAEGFMARGDNSTAISMYDNFYIEAQTVAVRQAALTGIIRAEGSRGQDTISRVLHGADTSMHTAAVRAAVYVPGRKATEGFAALLPTISPELQVILVDVLAKRGDRAVLPTIIMTSRHRDAAVRMAAIKAMGSLGDRSVVIELIKIAAHNIGEEQRVAREGLANLDAPGVDDVLISASSGPNNIMRTEAIRSIKERKVAHAGPTLFRIAEREIESLQIEALGALGVVAADEDLPELVSLLIKSKSAGTLRAAQAAVLAVAERPGTDEDHTKSILSAARRTYKDNAIRISLIDILGELADENSYSTVLALTRRTPAEVRAFALQRLAGWPTPRPLADLAKIAESTKDENDQALAFDGYTYLMTLPADRSEEETKVVYQTAVDLATTPARVERVARVFAAIGTPLAEDMLMLLPQPETNPSEAEAPLVLDILDD